jgi:hypothetical protein
MGKTEAIIAAIAACAAAALGTVAFWDGPGDTRSEKELQDAGWEALKQSYEEQGLDINSDPIPWNPGDC